MQNNNIIDEVVGAIRIFTNPPKNDKHSFKEAEKYLVNFEKEPQAWLVASKILDSDNYEKVVYIHASSILKKKLQYDSYQMSTSDAVPLAEAIIKFLVKYEDRACLSNLALALAILYLHAFEAIGNILEGLEKSLFKLENKQYVTLEVIKIICKCIAEVAYEKTIVIPKKKKQDYRDFLHQHIEKRVLEILDSIGRHENLEGRLKYKILDTFQEWIYFSNNDQESRNALIRNSCLQLVLQGLCDEGLANNARECLRYLMKNAKEPEDWPEIFELIYANIPNYIHRCKQVLEDDPQHAKEIIKVFVLFGKKFSKKILASPNEDLIQFLKSLLEFTGHPEIEGALEDLEDFWHTLAKGFEQINNAQLKAQRQQDFAPLFLALIKIAISRMVMSEEHIQFIETIDDSDASEYFDEFEKKDEERFYCKNLIHDCYEVVGFQNTFLEVCEILSEYLKNNTQKDQVEMLCQIEAILQAAKIVIKELPKSKGVDLMEFLNVLMELNFDSIKFNKTKISILAHSASRSNINSETLSRLFNYLVEQIKNERLMASAGTGIIALCKEHTYFVVENFDKFLGLTQNMDENEDLVIALAMALGGSHDRQLIERHLAQLIKPFAERLITNAYQENAHQVIFSVKFVTKQNEDIIEKMCLDLNKLAIIFDSLPENEDPQQEQPIEPLFKELWPYFKEIFGKFREVDDVIGKLCSLIKKIMRCLNLRFGPYILEYFKIIGENFKIHPHHSYLYAVEVSASIFGKIPELIPTMSEIYHHMSVSLYNFMKDKKIEDHDELIEDFFGMLFRYVKYIPSVIFSSETLEINLELAQLSIGIKKHPELTKALYFFLEQLFKNCNINPQDDVETHITQIVVQKYGPIYIKALIAEYLDYPKENEREYIRDILFASFIRIKDYTIMWLFEALKEVPEHILTNPEKEEMIENLAKIDVSHLKSKDKENRDRDSEYEIWDKFDDCLEIFDYRCKLAAMRTRV